MKALTLTQPWATLMALQSKRIETRSWPTHYRGEIIIHSSKKFPQFEREMCFNPSFEEGLHGLKPEELPLSQGLCVVRLIGCVKTTEMHKAEFIMGCKPSAKEIMFGNYTEGRYAWITEFVRRLPLNGWGPVKGALGLWEWDKEMAMHEKLASGETHL